MIIYEICKKIKYWCIHFMNTPRKSFKRSKYARSLKKHDRRRRSVKKSNPRHKRYSGIGNNNYERQEWYDDALRLFTLM
jgi:hypothetical protein